MTRMIQMQFTHEQMKVLSAMIAVNALIATRARMQSLDELGIAVIFDAESAPVFATLFLGVTQEEPDFPTLLAKLHELAKPFTAYMRSELTHTNEVQ